MGEQFKKILEPIRTNCLMSYNTDLWSSWTIQTHCRKEEWK